VITRDRTGYFRDRLREELSSRVTEWWSERLSATTVRSGNGGGGSRTTVDVFIFFKNMAGEI